MIKQVLYVCAATGLLLSFAKDKKKTKMALKKAWKSFENILPQFLAVLVLIGLALAILDADTISRLIGNESGMMGVMIAVVIGSVTLIPGFVAFPLAAALLESGAGYMQIAAFVSSLMMVGVATMPMEIKTFGRKTAILRNLAAVIFSVVSACVIGVIL